MFLCLCVYVFIRVVRSDKLYAKSPISTLLMRLCGRVYVFFYVFYVLMLFREAPNLPVLVQCSITTVINNFIQGPTVYRILRH